MHSPSMLLSFIVTKTMVRRHMDCQASATQRQGYRDAPHPSQFQFASRTALLSWAGFPHKPSAMRIEWFSQTFGSFSSLCIAEPSLHGPFHTTASRLVLHLLRTNQSHSIPNCSDQTSTTCPTRCSHPAPLQHQATTTKPVT